MTNKDKHKVKSRSIFSASSFLLGVLFTFIVAGGVFFSYSSLFSWGLNNEGQAVTLVEPVQAAEIYPEFVCGCCGKPLDPGNICCGDMKQKIDYIDTIVETGMSYDEAMMKTVKKFGFNSLANNETKQEIKEKIAANAPADAAKIVLEQTSMDFGEISQEQGEVSDTFSFKNKGQSDLIINELTTSCGCTSASIVYKGEEGPMFTMPGHGKENPQKWSVAIAPGDVAELKVYYDPNAHGPQQEQVLDITRNISIFSNDPVEFEKQVRIELTQIP